MLHVRYTPYRQLSVTQTYKYVLLRIFVYDYELYQCVYTIKNCVLKYDHNYF